MLEEVGKFLLEDILGESLVGLFRSARTSTARRIKVVGRLCLIASVASFALAVWRPGLIGLEMSLIIGLLAAVAAVAFGLWATALDACSGPDGSL
jgi:hypothetical protein